MELTYIVMKKVKFSYFLFSCLLNIKLSYQNEVYLNIVWIKINVKHVVLFILNNEIFKLVIFCMDVLFIEFNIL